jgi:hypothetical protein
VALKKSLKHAPRNGYEVIPSLWFVREFRVEEFVSYYFMGDPITEKAQFVKK